MHRLTRIACTYKLDLADRNKGFTVLSNPVDLMTSDLQPMYALTFGSILVLLYHIVSRLVSTGLYCYIILSSADCLHIIIYIGHIADCLNPIAIGWYRHRLLLASAGTTPSACQPIGCFDLLFAYLVSCRIKLTGTPASHQYLDLHWS